MNPGGIFGGDSLGALGIDPPFPDVYGCDENAQCQSGWCNTAIKVPGAKGQCQSRGMVVPTIGFKGESGSYCSSNSDCQVGLTCDTARHMCSVGNILIHTYAEQIGMQDAASGIPARSRSAAVSTAAAQANMDIGSSLAVQEGVYKSYLYGYNKVAGRVVRDTTSLPVKIASQVADSVQDLLQRLKTLFGLSGLGAHEMNPGGIFGQAALSGSNVGKKLNLSTRLALQKKFGMGCCPGVGSVVPDDFGVDLLKPSLVVTDEMIDEARALEAEQATNAMSTGALGLSGTKLALILGGVAVGVWMLTRPKRVKANKRTVSSSVRGRKAKSRAARAYWAAVRAGTILRPKK